MANYEEEDAEIMEKDFSDSIRRIRGHQPLFNPAAEEEPDEPSDDDHLRDKRGT